MFNSKNKPYLSTSTLGFRHAYPRPFAFTLNRPQLTQSQLQSLQNVASSTQNNPFTQQPVADSQAQLESFKLAALPARALQKVPAAEEPRESARITGSAAYCNPKSSQGTILSNSSEPCSAVEQASSKCSRSKMKSKSSAPGQRLNKKRLLKLADKESLQTKLRQSAQSEYELDEALVFKDQLEAQISVPQSKAAAKKRGRPPKSQEEKANTEEIKSNYEEFDLANHLRSKLFDRMHWFENEPCPAIQQFKFIMLERGLNEYSLSDLFSLGSEWLATELKGRLIEVLEHQNEEEYAQDLAHNDLRLAQGLFALQLIIELVMERPVLTDAQAFKLKVFCAHQFDMPDVCYDGVRLLKFDRTNSHLQRFMEQVYSYISSNRKHHVTHALAHLCGQLGRLRQAYEDLYLTDEKCYEGAQNFPIDKLDCPSDRHQERILYKLYIGTKTAHPQLNLRALKQMFLNPSMLVHDEVFSCIALLPTDNQEDVCRIIVQCADGLTPQPQCVRNISNELIKHEWLYTVVENWLKTLIDKNKLTVENLSQLLHNLGLLSKQKARKLLKDSKSLGQAWSQAQITLTSGVSDQIDQDKVQSWINAELLHDSAHLLMYNELQKIATKMATEDPTKRFRVDNYQIFQAAVAVANKSPMSVQVMETGSGKSFVIAIIAKHLRQVHPDKAVAVLTISDYLVRQMNQSIGWLLKDPEIKIAKMLDTSEDKFSAVLIDEGDEYARLYAVEGLERKKLQGIGAATSNMRTIVFTATDSPFLLGLCEQLPRLCKGNYVNRHIPKLRLSRNDVGGHSISYFSFALAGDLLTAFKRMLIEKMTERPVVIFTCGFIEDLKAKLGDFRAGTTVATWDILDESAVESFAGSHFDRSEGVFFLRNDLMRGFDMKFSRDAFVMIFCEEGGFTYTQVRQMIGRGSRDQGQCTGAYFTCEFGQSIEDQSAKLKMKELQYDDSFVVLGMLYRSWPHLTKHWKGVANDAMKDGQWRINRQTFEQKHKGLYEALKSKMA